MRVLLILVDGMRPDSITDLPKAQEMIGKSSYTMEATTVMPSVTLPCHMSLFHSVDPSRHGTAINIYAPQVRPINGLCEVIKNNGKNSAFFYDWEELRDLTRPGSLHWSYFCKGLAVGLDKADRLLTDAAIEYLAEYDTEFTFLYLGEADEVGHACGWMSEEYLAAIRRSWDAIGRIVNSLPDDFTVMVTADHGGHDRTYGTDSPENMTIPFIIKGKDFKPGEKLENVSIKDIAPTAAKLLDIAPDQAWEGKSLV